MQTYRQTYQEVEVADELILTDQCGSQAKLAVGLHNGNDLSGARTHTDTHLNANMA